MFCLRLTVCSLLAAVCLLTGCVSTQRALPPDEATWQKLIKTTKQLEWSEADQGAAFEKAQKALGLEDLSPMALEGPLFIAAGDRRRVSRHPLPRIWKTEDQNLLCAGDLFADGQIEYVLGIGWFGPMGGMICIYDQHLRKITEMPADDIFALQLEDLLGDGHLELLCWQDEHHGSGEWQRYLTIFRVSRTGILQPVWQEYTYSEWGNINISKQKIRIHCRIGRPAIIDCVETYDLGHCKAEGPDDFSYDYVSLPWTTKRYEWDPAADKFTESPNASSNLEN